MKGKEIRAERERLCNLLEDKGLYINRHEPARQMLLWDMCRSAWWYRTILDNSNRERAKSITFDDMASMFSEAAKGDSDE